MTPEQMEGLARNLSHDGVLTSVPLCYRHEDGSLEILSGNQRVKAAVASGIRQAPVMVITNPIPEERRYAIALSHNARTGQDDQAALFEIWRSLKLAQQSYTGISEGDFGKLPELDLTGINVGNVHTHVVDIVFIAGREDAFKALLARISDKKKMPETYLARFEAFDRFFDTMIRVKTSMGIVNSAVALERLVELAGERLDQLDGGNGPA